MSAKYYTILTETGKSKVANAAALGRQIKLTHIAVGDGDGSEYDPIESQTALKKENHRSPISNLGTDAQNPNWIVAEGLIPVDVGGWFVREVGIFDEDGDLFAIGKYPETYKPTLAEGTGRDLYIRFIMVVSNTGTIDLKIDPTVAIATRDWTSEQITLHVDASKKQLREEINRLGDTVLNRINIRKGGTPWGTNVVNILGDSISHGANVEDISNDSWVGISRKLLNLQYGSTNHGFVTICDKMTNSHGTFQEIHKLTKTGNWSSISGPSASHLMNGYAYVSSTSGDSLVLEVPTISKEFRIWYERRMDGGSFKLYVNDELVTTMDTASPDSSGEGGFYWTGSHVLKDSGHGKCTIKMEVVGDGAVSIMGVSYLDQWEQFQVNNFSQSGRKARDLSESVIKNAVVGANAVIFALGHNDQSLSGSEKDSTIANLELLAEKCIQYGTKLYILDFCWSRDYSNYVRAKLKEISETVPRSTYLNFAEYFKIDGSTVGSSELIDSIKFLSDGSHPTKFGHQVIAETLATAMSLSFTSKKAGEMFSPVWEPIDEWLSQSFKNTFENARYITACRRNGNDLAVRIYFDYGDDTSVAIPAGQHELFKLPAKYFVPYTSTIPVAASALATMDPTKQCYLTVHSGANSMVKYSVPDGNLSNRTAIQFTIPINWDLTFDMY
ncbi:phage tail-collar fiber domain-containing protein [Vibrio alginolyticus]|uniref:phage tail-collar fiber domain-containing protein n=1 Tax=Vibrio alginolyticus TaxID=663 RepID=UPI00215BC1F7|nr:phage tail protein [Vibrio alginolyticus]MCR9529234.1 phage tail protein [Vibrio alginolyticus]